MKAKLKIDPKNMPKPWLGTSKANRTSSMSKEAADQVTDYFRDQRHRWNTAWVKSNSRLKRAKMH